MIVATVSRFGCAIHAPQHVWLTPRQPRSRGINHLPVRHASSLPLLQARDRFNGVVILCMFHPVDNPLARGWVGRIDGERVLHLAAQTLQSFFSGGSHAREHAEYRLDDVQLLPPVLHPPTIREFTSFESHAERLGRQAAGPLEARPAFSFANTAAISGTDDAIPFPSGTAQLAYGLEVAAVVGVEGQIGGFTIMNGWCAQDVQRAELEIGLGPAKSRDFATSLGPVVVTPDELGDLRLGMVARVNGEIRTRASLGEMRWSWDELIEHASCNTVLRPGDIIASGRAIGDPSLGEGAGGWLQPGDVVELEVDGIGVLRNTVGPLA